MADAASTDRRDPPQGLRSAWSDFSSPISTLAALIIVLLAAQALGAGSRGFEDSPGRHRTSGGPETFALLRELGIRGRIVVFAGPDFTTYPSDLDEVALESALISRQTTVPVDSENLVMASAIFGIARQVVSVAAGEGSSPAAHGGATGPTRIEGVPVSRADSAALPDFGEKAVVVVQEGGSSGIDPSVLARLTDPAFADTVIIQEGP